MSIDEIVDERSLREIYLEGFRRAVQEGGARTVMTAYNKVNGEFANENTHLLQDILYGEWGFDGVAVTDWGGNNDRVAGLQAGNQLEMPSTGGITDAEIVQAVQDGSLDEVILNERVDSLLKLIFETTKALENKPTVDYDEHHEKAIDAAKRSAVLLKNADNTLPLAKGTRVAVIGDFAKMPRYQGAGSSLVNPTRLDDAHSALSASGLEVVGFAPGFKRFGGRSTRRTRQAVRLAKQADVVLLFLGLDEASEAEGLDRTSMRLPVNQLTLVRELCKAHTNIVVVLAGGAPVELPFVNEVKALLHGHLAGQGGGQAIADIVTGAYNPSGKLALTYPLRYEDVPSARYYPGREVTAEHREAIYVGYRYYDTKQVPVLFPFGYGLSYTSFRYRDLEVDGDDISCTVTNTGSVVGEEVVQLYVQPCNPVVFRAKQELKAFTKVSLQPGESQRITLQLDDKAFAYYNVTLKDWVIEPGEYLVAVGSSSADIHLTQAISKQGEQPPNPYIDKKVPSYDTANIQAVTSAEFGQLLDTPLSRSRWDRRAPLTLDDTVAQLQYKNLLGRAVYGLCILARKFLLVIHKPIQANNVMFIVNLPFKKIEGFTGGKVSTRTIRRFLRLVNV